MIALDFETRYTAEYSVKALGHALYCRDPRFLVTAVAAHSPTASVSCSPATFPWALLHGKQIIAHNAPFDRAVFLRLQELGAIPPTVAPTGWLDTSGACVYLGLPRSLQGAVRALFGHEIDKTIRDRMAGDQLDLFDDVQAYAASDAEWAWKIWDRIGDLWPESERRIHALTHAMGDRGVRIDANAAHDAAAKLAGDIAGIESALPFWPPGSGPALAQACAERGEPVPPSTAAKSPEVDKWCKDNQKSASPLWVRQVQQWRRANRTREVVKSMLERVHPATGRMQYSMKYFGAEQTGRWSGGGGLNMQALNRSASEGVNLRGLIVPEAGHKFIVADFAQIEARTLLWLAGDFAFLDTLREMDIYEATARQMLGYTDPRPLKAVNPALRSLAKPIRLGLQFNMKAKTLQFTALRDYGMQIAFEDCERYVEDFAEANPLTVALWERLTEAFAKRSGQPAYTLPLPSGRKIRYWEPEAAGWKLSASAVKTGPRYEYHAGTLAENYASGTAREILALAWLRCADAGYAPILSIHDELVFEVPAPKAQDAQAEIVALMQTPPDWPLADRLPLEVEAKVSERYCK